MQCTYVYDVWWLVHIQIGLSYSTIRLIFVLNFVIFTRTIFSHRIVWLKVIRYENSHMNSELREMEWMFFNNWLMIVHFELEYEHPYPISNMNFYTKYVTYVFQNLGFRSFSYSNTFYRICSLFTKNVFSWTLNDAQ